MSLLPHVPAYVHRVRITDYHTADGRESLGLIYKFEANPADIATIPNLTHTNIIVGGHASTSQPWRGLRHVEIRTLHGDMLARMFAMGSAEIARCAHLLHMVGERQQNREPEYGTTLKQFLWPRQEEVPDSDRARYDQALAGDYETNRRQPEKYFCRACGRSR